MNTKYIEKIAQFKTDIKLIAEYTKTANRLSKEALTSGDDTKRRDYVRAWILSKKIPNVVTTLDVDKHHSRHMQVAYSLLKGNTLDQIEGNSRKKLDRSLVRDYVVKYTSSIELADSIDLKNTKVKAGGMYDVIKQLITDQTTNVDDYVNNTVTNVMNLIKGGK